MNFKKPVSPWKHPRSLSREQGEQKKSKVKKKT